MRTFNRNPLKAMNAIAIMVLVIAMTGGGFAAPPAQADSCPNAASRAGLSANLPDCRAFEQVSPQEKGGFDALFYGARRSSPSGEAFEFESNGAFAGAAGAPHANDYVARRSGTTWTTQSITPYQQPNGLAAFFPVSGYIQFTPDLSRGLFMNANPPEAGGEGSDTRSFYVRNGDGSYRLVTPAPANASVLYQPTFAGASTDLSRVFFEAAAALTPEAPAELSNLYEWAGGQVKLVGVLPDGSPAPEGASVAAGAVGFMGRSANLYSSVSPDGSQVVFRAGSPAQLYLRTGASTTVSISGSQKAGSVGEPAPDGATFMGAVSADGKTISAVYFTSIDELTNDANTGQGKETIYGRGSDLYEYDVASGQLRDLTVDTNPEDLVGARVSSEWFAPSSDGSYLYFIASGILAPGARFNEENLYVLHEGAIKYVGPASKFSISSAMVSKDGRRLVYLTSIPETSDNNNGYEEVYLYDEPSGTWTCVSCVPGVPVAASAQFGGFLTGYGSFATYQPRNLTDDGRRVFFETEAALSPQDTNGQADVYEWENGVVHLVSTGQGANGAHFMDASANGDDAFIATRQQLLPSDQDDNVDVYDVRVDGGTPRQPSPLGCTGTGCQGVPGSPPIFATPASVTFNGSGNFAAPAKKAVRKKEKPSKRHVKKHKKPRRRHKAGSGGKSSKRNSRRG